MAENITTEEIQKVMEKYDRDSTVRSFTDYRKYILSAICILFSIVQLYAAFTGRIPNTQLRPLHLGFVMTLAYILYPISKGHAKKDKLPFYDIILACLSLICCMYIAIQHVDIANRYGKVFSPGQDGYLIYMLDIINGALLIVLLAEICRRVVGYPILIVATIFVLYGLFANHFPGFLARKPIKITKIITTLCYSTEGIMGTPLGASASFIFLFVLFGSFLDATKVGQFFIDFANSIAGNKRGGPAKVSVLSSALMGTVSGSSVANTVGTGSFTIPMMKSLGYKGEFAGAVEAAASTGGQIMPPVMGAAAFLMAESVGVSYTEVVKSAIIPAMLYFAGIWIIIDLEARKYNLKGLDKENLPVFKTIFINKGYLIIPLIVIIYFLSAGYTPIYSALIGIMSSALCGLGRRIHASLILKSRGKRIYEQTDESVKDAFKSFGSDIISSLQSGAKSVLSVAVACAIAGVIVGMITLTGLGQKLGNGLVDLAHGSKLLTLILTMLASIILGMGVPTTANYLITSTVMAPAVMKVMGCSMLSAHMFTFYFGIVADITPPVALAAMAGSAIAKSDPLKTGINAVKLAIAAFIIPYMFVFNEQMLMINASWIDIVRIISTSLLGMFAIGISLEGYYKTISPWYQRALFLIGGLLLVDAGLITDIVGISLIAVLLVLHLVSAKKSTK